MAFAGRLDKARVAAPKMDPAGTHERRGLRPCRGGRLPDEGLRARGEPLRRVRSACPLVAGTWSPAEAQGLLKRGTALELAERYDEALAALAESDEVASRTYGTRLGPRPTRWPASPHLSYNARLQPGDTHLRARRYAAALDQYAAARERARPARDRAGEPLRRPRSWTTTRRSWS